MEHRIFDADLRDFATWLRREEKSPGTVEKYLRDGAAFAAHMGGAPVTKDAVAAWRDGLAAQGYAPATVNSMVAAVNALLRFLGWEDCRVKALRLQRRVFRDQSRELTRGEYDRLLAAAGDRPRLALLMETICSTGIRVSEVRYITVEAARDGQAQIALKGKIRVILFPGKLRRKLLKYAEQQKIASYLDRRCSQIDASSAESC